MAHHWFFLTVVGFLVAGIVFVTLWWGYGLLLRSGASPRKQLLRRRIISLWRRERKAEYELVDRLEA